MNSFMLLAVAGIYFLFFIFFGVTERRIGLSRTAKSEKRNDRYSAIIIAKSKGERCCCSDLAVWLTSGLFLKAQWVPQQQLSVIRGLWRHTLQPLSGPKHTASASQSKQKKLLIQKSRSIARFNMSSTNRWAGWCWTLNVTSKSALVTEHCAIHTFR